MSFIHKTLRSFWRSYADLPEEVRRRAEKQYELLATEPAHPSVQLKPVGAFWSARVSDAYRALSIRKKNIFVWFWIGNHDDYERLLRG
ncbi:MAG TPA: hypothetical protein VF283_12090 [Bryobacteraceae bacterium]